MKNTNTFKKIASIIILALLITTTHAQIRLVKVNTTTNAVTVKNFSTTVTTNVGGYFLCVFPNYPTLNSLTIQHGDVNLSPGESVTVISSINLPIPDGELGLYHTGGNFGNSANMADYMQWGAPGHTRESVAVSAGIWTAGTFINVSPPYNYSGNGSQNGVAFWDTSLGVEDLSLNTSFNISPNPTSNSLNINYGRTIQSGNILIADLTGKILTSRTITNSSSEEINVSEWAQGLYFVSLRTDEGAITKRFLKQ